MEKAVEALTGVPAGRKNDSGVGSGGHVNALANWIASGGRSDPGLKWLLEGLDTFEAIPELYPKSDLNGRSFFVPHLRTNSSSGTAACCGLKLSAPSLMDLERVVLLVWRSNSKGISDEKSPQAIPYHPDWQCPNSFNPPCSSLPLRSW